MAAKLQVVQETTTSESLSLDEIRAWVRTLPDAYLDCRVDGHHWRPRQGGREGRGWRRVRGCSSCDMLQEHHLTYDGHLASTPRYSPPEGYAAPKGTGYFDADVRAMCRLEQMERMERARRRS